MYDVDTLLRSIDEAIRQGFWRRAPYLGVVEEVSGAIVRIRRIGYAEADGQFYATATGGTFAVDDLVVALPIEGGSPIVIRVNDATNVPVAPSLQWIAAAVADRGAATASAYGMPAPHVAAGTMTDGDDTDGPWILATTGASSGAAAALRSEPVSSLTQRSWHPRMEALIKTPATITNIRLWVGLANGGVAASSVPGVPMAMFRYATDTDTTEWRVRTRDGSTGGVSDTGVPFEASRVYLLRIDLDDDEARFFIDGELVATRTALLPPATTGLGHNCSLTTLTAAARSFRWGRVRVWHGRE